MRELEDRTRRRPGEFDARPGSSEPFNEARRPGEPNRTSRSDPSSGAEAHPYSWILGKVLAGKYKVGRLIGSGGMGSIFEAVDITLNRTVAVKLLSQSLVNDGKSVQRFQREGTAASRLDHKNIVKVYEFGMHNEVQPYMVMEYVVGDALGNIIKSEGKLSVFRATNIVLQICDGLAHAHEHKVVHRDLKPGNILVYQEQGEEVAKIVDFGIAKIASGDDTSHRLTSTGEILGSPLYMSPEQCYGSNLDGRSDIYSLGCLFYECLVGYPPLSGDSPLVTIAKHQQEIPISLREAALGEKFPDELERIVAKMLAKRPDDRYQSVAALEFELANFLAGKSFKPAPQFEVRSEGEQFMRDSAASSFRHFQNIKIAAEPPKKIFTQRQKLYYLFGGGTLLLLGIVICINWILSPRESIKDEEQVRRALGSVYRHASSPAEQISDVPDVNDADVPPRMMAYPGLKTIQSFSCSGMDLNDWTFLKQMRQLHTVDLSSSNLKDFELRYMLKLPIEHLNLSNNVLITHAGFVSLRTMPKLKFLEIRECKPLNIGTVSAEELNPNLVELDLDGADASTQTINALASLKHLERLSMRYAPLDKNGGIEALAQLKHLHYLNIDAVKISDEQVAALRQALPDCVIDENAEMKFKLRPWLGTSHLSKG